MRRSSTATSRASRPPSSPEADRRGMASDDRDTSACSSTSSGRWPSMAGKTADPHAPCWRSPRNSPLGSGTPTSPSSVISNRPSSPAGPNRCLTARSSRRAWWRSPSKVSTVSTTCSRTRGPARAPSLVTCPTSTVVRSRALASCTRAWAQPLTWVTDPGPDSTSGSQTVWMESTTSTSGPTSSTAAAMPGRPVSADQPHPSAPARPAGQPAA